MVSDKDSIMIDCRYYSNDICGAIPQSRGNDCKSPIRNACCYTCGQRNTCSIYCDSLYPKIDKATPELLPEEEQLEVGRVVLRNMYVIMGILLCITGGIFSPFFGNPEVFWILFFNIPSWRTFLMACFASIHVVLLLLGILLISYGLIRVGRKTTEEPKLVTSGRSIGRSADEQEQKKPKEPRKKRECGNCAYYLTKKCPRGYPSDNETWRTQKTCDISTFKREQSTD